MTRHLALPRSFSMLTRKAIRDLWQQRGPALAIALVVMAGVASFVSLGSMVPHLRGAQQRFYDTARFADVWVVVSRAPLALVRTLRTLPGVAAVEVRVAEDVVLDVPGQTVPATGHIIGHPVSRPLDVNRLVLRQGRLMAAGRDDEVVISEGFAEANRLSPGDSLGAVMNGRWRRLHVVGVALTPEYVLELKPGELFPDSRRYGVIWMAEEAVQAAFGLQDAWNEATLKLVPGSSETAVIRRLDDLLGRYGTLGAHGRDQQASHRFLSDEVKQAGTFATAAPIIFLGVSAFLVNLVLARMVSAQREQIGMMKAFGMPTATLTRHYLQIALLPVLVGTAAGAGVGLWFADVLAELYGAYYRMPDATFTPRADIVVASVLITSTSAVIGAIGAVRRVARLPAAEAMRPEAPVRFRQGWFEHSWLHRVLAPIGRLMVRSIVRRPARAALATLGMALSIAVVMVGTYSFDAINALRDVHFTENQREDLAVTFTAPAGDAALRELAQFAGVLRVEPTWTLPVRFRHGVYEQQVGLTARVPGAALRRVVGASRQEVPMPGEGVTLSRALADLLHVGIGDTLGVQVLTGERRVANVRVAALVDDLIGTNAWSTLPDMTALANGVAYDGAVMLVDARLADSVTARLRRTPGIAGIGARAAVLANFDRVMEESFNVTLVSLLCFATVLSVGVVYNTARIALSERSRELASLRVLGFTRQEVSRMLFGELALLSTLAVPVGFLIGAALCASMAAALSSDLFRLPFVLSARTYGTSVLVLLAAGVASAWLVRRRLDAVDLVGVLKTRE